MKLCDEMDDLFVKYLCGNTTKEETRACLSHLASCPNCRKEIAFLIALKKEAGQHQIEVPEEVLFTAFSKIPNDRKQESVNSILAQLYESLQPVQEVFTLTGKVIQLAYQTI